MKDYTKIHNEIEIDINDVINKTIFYSDELKNYQIQSIIGTILEKYRDTMDIYQYIVQSNYPEVKVYIKYDYLSEIDQIYVLKFDRINKIEKLNQISNDKL